MDIEMYVLGLLKFKDGKIVFNEKELDCICSKIGECIENEKTDSDEKMEKKDGWCVYTLNLENFGKEVPEDVKIKSARLGYCHHRVIMHFSLDLKGGEKEDKYPQFREARETLKKEADELINECVKEKINEIIPTGKVRKGGSVIKGGKNRISTKEDLVADKYAKSLKKHGLARKPPREN